MPSTTYAQALRTPAPLRSWEAGAARVDIIAATPSTDPGTADSRLAITCRLTCDGRVVFSGDDITAPPTSIVAATTPSAPS